MGFEHHYCHRDKYESLRQVRCSTGFYRDVCDGRESCEHDSTTKNGRDAPKQKFESADSIGHRNCFSLLSPYFAISSIERLVVLTSTSTSTFLVNHFDAASE